MLQAAVAPKTIKVGLNKKVNPKPRPDFFDGDQAGSRAHSFVQAVN